jgi:beta-glucanase (GH16 family)
MNLFWKKLFGGLENTEKMEKAEEALLLAYKKYTEVLASEALAEYKQLFHIVKSADFKEKKKVLQNRKFKDTEEYRKSTRYEKLERDTDIKLYYQVVASKELKSFLDFKTTDEYELLGSRKEVRKSDKLKQFKLYEKSKQYKTYVRFHDSDVIKEYEELKKAVAKDEFIKSKNFWADPNRWQKTEEYKQEKAFYALADREDIRFYEDTDEKQFDKLKAWTLSFEDTFDKGALDASKWSIGFFHKAPLKKLYSFANEKQAYFTKNVSVSNNQLQIKTIEEKAEGAAWDAKHGFITKSFDFTSGVINAGDFFQQKTGLIRAKIAVKGAANVSHAFWMGAEGKLPLCNIFFFDGHKIQVGNIYASGQSVAKETQAIQGISAHDFFIYSLEWTEKELIWRINNVEIFRTDKGIPKEAMFPAFSSFVSEKQKGGNSTLVVDWIRIYTKNK